MQGEERGTAMPATGGSEVCFESLPQAMKRIKRTIIEDTLAAYDGNRTHAARRLGISRPNLQKTIKRLGIS